MEMWLSSISFFLDKTPLKQRAYYLGNQRWRVYSYIAKKIFMYMYKTFSRKIKPYLNRDRIRYRLCIKSFVLRQISFKGCHTSLLVQWFTTGFWAPYQWIMTPINTHYLQLMVVADYGKPGPPGADVGDGGVQGCAQRHAQLALEFTWTLILHHI